MRELHIDHELSSRFLGDPKVIDVCRARDFARVFALLRGVGVYPSRIARLCEMTPSRVGEIVAGKRTLTQLTVIERVSDGLRVPGDMLGLARRPWENVPEQEQSSVVAYARGDGG